MENGKGKKLLSLDKVSGSRPKTPQSSERGKGKSSSSSSRSSVKSALKAKPKSPDPDKAPSEGDSGRDKSMASAWTDAAIRGLIALREVSGLHVSDYNDDFLAEKKLLRNWHKLETTRDPTSCFGMKTKDGAVTELEFTDQNVVMLQVTDEAAWKEAFAGVPQLQKLTLEGLGWDKSRDESIYRCFPSSLAGCRMLTHLSCPHSLNGPFPWRELSHLTLLEELNFTFCHFEESSISPQLAQCTRLRSLLLMRCNLIGEIPPMQLPALQKADLQDNDLSGTLPREMASWPLQRLDLSRNAKLCGAIPEGLLSRANLDLGTAGTRLMGSVVSFHACSFAMHLLDRDTVLSLDEMPTHEAIKDRLTVIQERLPNEMLFLRGPSTSTLIRRSALAFISHRWLRPGRNHPDDEANSKWRLLQRLLRDNPPCRDHQRMYPDAACDACRNALIYLWVDLACIPQAGESHGGRSAVNSLPSYVQHCGRFYLLHGNEGSREHGRERDPSFDDYMRGGWTLQEAMSAQCPVCAKDGSWSSIRTLSANFDTGEVQPLSLGEDLVNPLDGVQIPRNMYSRKDPLRRLDSCHQMLLPGIEATLSVLEVSPKAEAMREGIGRLRQAVECVRQRIFCTAQVEGQLEGTVERGGYINGERSGLHIRLSADDEEQHEVWYANGVMVGAPRLMLDWETLETRFFRATPPDW